MTIPFTKMVGAGNDFVIIDTNRSALPSRARQWPAISKALCDRHRGIGADGVLVLEPSDAADVTMRVFNPDGSEAQMCGNGARCVARYLTQDARRTTRDARGRRVTIATQAGILCAQVKGRRIAMRMTDPTELELGLALDVGRRKVRLGFVNTGVPHAVVPVERLDQLDVSRLGRLLRYHRLFSPRGSNVNFIQADPKRTNRVRVRTYERGVEDETLACGTGVAAAAVIHALRSRHDGHGRRRRIEVETRSGDVLTVSLVITGRGRTRRVSDVVLEGPAARVFDGAIDWSPHSGRSAVGGPRRIR